MSQSSHISHTFPSSIVQAPKTDYAIIQRQDYVEDSPIHADGRSLHAEDAILSTATIDNNSASSLTDWASAASQPLSQQKGSKSTASPQDIPLLSQPGRSDSGRPSVSHSPTLWVYGIMPRRKAALKAEQRIATQLTALSSCDAEVAPLETLIHNPKKRRRTATRPDDTDVCSFSETSPKRRRVLQRGQDEYNPIAQDAPPEINEHAATLQPQNDLYLDNIRSPGDYVRGECDYRRYAYAQIHGPVLCSFCFEDPERSGTPGRKSRKSKKSKRSEHHRSRTLSRLPDVGYRHLKKCVKFKQSKYYKEKTHGSKTPWTIEGDIVKDAVAAHMMVVRLPCQRNPAYLARVALFQGIQPENVEQHAANSDDYLDLSYAQPDEFPDYDQSTGTFMCTTVTSLPTLVSHALPYLELPVYGSELVGTRSAFDVFPFMERNLPSVLPHLTGVFGDWTTAASAYQQSCIAPSALCSNLTPESGAMDPQDSSDQRTYPEFAHEVRNNENNIYVPQTRQDQGQRHDSVCSSFSTGAHAASVQTSTGTENVPIHMCASPVTSTKSTHSHSSTPTPNSLDSLASRSPKSVGSSKEANADRVLAPRFDNIPQESIPPRQSQAKSSSSLADALKDDTQEAPAVVAPSRGPQVNADALRSSATTAARTSVVNANDGGVAEGATSSVAPIHKGRRPRKRRALVSDAPASDSQGVRYLTRHAAQSLDVTSSGRTSRFQGSPAVEPSAPQPSVDRRIRSRLLLTIPPQSSRSRKRSRDDADSETESDAEEYVSDSRDSDYTDSDNAFDDEDANDDDDAEFVPETWRAPTTKRRVVASASRSPKAGKGRVAKSSKTHSGKETRYYKNGSQKVPYSHQGDWKRHAFSKLHTRAWCPWCHHLRLDDPNGPKGPGTYSRLRDSPKRHLVNCEMFKKSRFYAALLSKGKRKEEIIASALPKFAVAVQCVNDEHYKQQLKEMGLTHEDVLAELQPRGTVYKWVDCQCCALPPASTFKNIQ
ncbi:hypothetical protein ACG7TL_006161 [Trametes sanguinea]